jgi:intracellular septation protein A
MHRSVISFTCCVTRDILWYSDFVNSICCENEGALSSVTDIAHYIIIRKLLDFIFNTFSIHILVGYSNILIQDFSSIRLPTQVWRTVVHRVDELWLCFLVNQRYSWSCLSQLFWLSDQTVAVFPIFFFFFLSWRWFLQRHPRHCQSSTNILNAACKEYVEKIVENFKRVLDLSVFQKTVMLVYFELF